MSSNQIKRWQILCISENRLVEVYSPTMPTLCPNDHPDRSLDKTRVVLLENIKNNNTELVDSVPGQFQHTTLHIHIPTVDTDNVSVHDFFGPLIYRSGRLLSRLGPNM